MPQKRKTIFVVKGKHDDIFPLDMLRYDSCYPSDSYAVDKLMVACGPKYTYNHQFDRNDITQDRLDFAQTGFVIELISDNVPRKERWESFGWEVIAFRKC